MKGSVAVLSRVVLFTLTAYASLVLPKLAHACPVCFGDPDSPETQGVRLAIIFLLCVTFGVLGGFGTFFFYLMRRAKNPLEAPLDHEGARRSDEEKVDDL